MFILSTLYDQPIYYGLMTLHTRRVLGKFDTYNNACGYAFNVCGFTTSDEFYVDYEDE